MPEQIRMDAGNVYFARDLEYVKSKTYDTIQAPLKAMQLFPVVSTAGWNDSIKYDSYTSQGMAQIIANFAEDLPTVNVTAVENIATVKEVGVSYSFSYKDAQQSMLGQKQLPTRLANAAAQAHRQTWNSIAFYGASEYNLPGFLTNTNITNATAATGAASDTLWSTKTADEILADMNGAPNDIVSLTNGVWEPDTIALPVSQYSLISSLRISDTNITVLDFFLKNSPYIKEVIPANELSSEQLAANGLDSTFTDSVMICYKRSEDVLSLEMPIPFTQLDQRPKGLGYEVPCLSRIAGVLVYYPAACSITDGI